MSYLTKILRGQETARIVTLGHDRIPTFGVGEDLGKKEWAAVFRQLLAGGYLTLDAGGYGSLLLTPKSRSVLKGEETLLLRKMSEKQTAAPESRSELEPHELGVWEALRRCRLEIAREEGVPPYVVAHDAHLLALLRRWPDSLEDMLEVNGFGESKVSRYGQGFLDALKGCIPPESLAS